MSHLIFVGENPRLRSQLQEIAESARMEFHNFSTTKIAQFGQEPAIIVVELELKGSVEAVSEWKRLWSSCMIAGSIALPVQELWHA
ncbi:MAG TPA: hypothetical protein VI958_05560, partial [Acidobacteriota bacterium]